VTGLAPLLADATQPAVPSSQIVIAPLLVGLATAVLSLVARPFPRARRVVSLLGVVAYAAAVAVLVDAVFLPLGSAPAVLTYQVSNWPAPVGITLVADGLSAFMLAVAAAVSVPVLAFSVLYVDEYGQRLTYHPLFHFMLVGVTGSFLTGDLFNLFVWFEVMLMSSYVLVVFYSGPEHTRAALQYVVLNLVGSALMLLAIGGLYATTGTLNMAHMAALLSAPAAAGVDPLPVLGLSAILFAVFVLKAGIVPFHFWVPAAYRAAPAPVAAMLAGVVKKVGVYAVVRLYFTVFAAAAIDVSLPGLAVQGVTILPAVSGESVLAFYGPVLFVMATASIVLGGLGAVSRDNFDDVLSYSSIGQVGFIVLPLAVAATASDPGVTALGIAAALIYTLSHALAKSTLFLASGTIHEMAGTIRFSRIGGITERAPVFSLSVFVAGVALVGIPPVVGFFGKFLVFQTAVEGGSVLALAVALGGAALTVAYFTSAWNRGFWGVPGDAVDGPVPRRLVAVVAVGAALLLAVGLGFDPVIQAARAGAEAALDRGEYVEAVLPDDLIPAGVVPP
jgi:multicomponent Na+:H+ antiporter subunit D